MAVYRANRRIGFRIGRVFGLGNAHATWYRVYLDVSASCECGMPNLFG